MVKVILVPISRITDADATAQNNKTDERWSSRWYLVPFERLVAYAEFQLKPMVPKGLINSIVPSQGDDIGCPC